MGFYAEPWLREARDRIRSFPHETAGESAEGDFNELAEAVEKAIKAALIESHGARLTSMIIANWFRSANQPACGTYCRPPYGVEFKKSSPIDQRMSWLPRRLLMPSFLRRVLRGKIATIFFRGATLDRLYGVSHNRQRRGY